MVYFIYGVSPQALAINVLNLYIEQVLYFHPGLHLSGMGEKDLW